MTLERDMDSYTNVNDCNETEHTHARTLSSQGARKNVDFSVRVKKVSQVFVQI